MKKITLTALSVAIALGLAACGKAPETTTTETAKPAAEQQATAAVAALVSGVDKENFDSAVRFQDDFFFVIARRQRSLVSLGTGSAISMSSFWGVKRLQNLVYDPRRGEDDDAG